MFTLLKKQSPSRIIAIGFASLILVGSLLLFLPCSLKDGVSISYIDALYTSTSAVCVTGLVPVDPGDTFTVFGQVVIALLIQAGGLGVATVGAGIMLAIGKKVDVKGRSILSEAMNVDSRAGLVKLIRKIFFVTILFETLGAALSFLVFVQDYSPLTALGVSVFHSIASFNNAGFDILGGFQSLTGYRTDILLNIVTAALIFFGGIGFLVMRDVWDNRHHLKRISMHSKVVLFTSAVLIVVGTVLLYVTEDISVLGAFFTSVSARTAGFATFSMGAFSVPGLLSLCILMFIGASSGSTGGGIKTSTFFVLVQGIRASATNQSEKAFHYSIPKEAFRKAAVITLLASGVVITGTYLIGIFEPSLSFMDVLFEVVSAFGTVGLSTGITPGLCVGSKIVTILIMYIGRLGPLTVATLWHFSKGERITYPEGNISIG